MPEFLYTTVKKIRDAGIPATELPDAQALELIKLCGLIINRLTDQWFAPVAGSFKLDGRGTPFAHLDNFIPIAVLTAVEVGGIGGNTPTLVENTEYAWIRDKRIVELLGDTATFPKTPLGTSLTGVFGWLESPKDVSTTVTAPVASGATSVFVASTVGFKVGDQVLFGNEAVPISEIPSTLELKFDALEFAIATGATARTLGRTPMEIQRACTLLVADRRLSIPDEEEADIASRIQSESTEGYSYSLAPLSSEDKQGLEGGGGQPTSGNAAVDDILQRYTYDGLYLGYA